MKEKVLFVNACLRGKEDSRTYGLCTTFLEEFSKNHKHYELEEIDLAAAGIEPIDGTDVNWILPLQKEKNYEDPVFDLAKQFNIEVNVIETKNTWKNSHNVPDDTVVNMINRWEPYNKAGEY